MAGVQIPPLLFTEQVTSPLGTLVFLPIKWESPQHPAQRAAERIKQDKPDQVLLSVPGT